MPDFWETDAVANSDSDWWKQDAVKSSTTATTSPAQPFKLPGSLPDVRAEMQAQAQRILEPEKLVVADDVRTTPMVEASIQEAQEGLVKFSKLAPTSQQVQDALDVLKAANVAGVANPRGPTIQQQLEGPSTPPTTEAKIVSGAVQAGLTVPETLSSPLGIATLGTGALGATGARVVSGAFAADMLRHTPEKIVDVYEALKLELGPEEATKRIGDLALNTAMLAAAGKHAVTPIPAITPLSVAAVKAEAAGAPATAEALKAQQQTTGVQNAIQEREAAPVPRDVPKQPAGQQQQVSTAQGAERVPPSREAEAPNAPSGAEAQQVAQNPIKPETPEHIYDASLAEFRKASGVFRKVREAYRAKQIGDEEFLKARAEFDKASEVSDAAETVFIAAKNAEPISPPAAESPAGAPPVADVSTSATRTQEPAAAVEAPKKLTLKEIAEGKRPNNRKDEAGFIDVGAIIDSVYAARDKLKNAWATRGNKAIIAQFKDAADNDARITGKRFGNSVRLEAQKEFGDESKQALDAVGAVIEAGGDRNRLAQFITQSTGQHAGAEASARFADANWERLQPLADLVREIHDAQIAEEHAAGINTEFREDYIKHAFDADKLPNRPAAYFGTGGGGGGSGKFRAARKFDTLYDAIEAGYGNAIVTMDASKLVDSRVSAGQRMINDRAWVASFRGVDDPTTSKPVITDAAVDKNGVWTAPTGYDAVPILPGQYVAVHKGYRSIFDAVTGNSKIEQAEIAGVPVGKAVLSTAAGIKHGLLLFDTFHASRIMQKMFFTTGKVGWNKGLSLLEYSTGDLAEAVRQGEITQEMANYATANRPTADLLVSKGLNVGRIQEALRSEVVRNIPGIGTFNRWVFDKVTRGVMIESALIEFERVQANNPTMTLEQVATKVARDINVTFGNIGRQGLFKSRTMQDLARVIALAPQWVESMARSEIGGFGQIGKSPIDAALGKGLQVGTLGKAMATGIISYVVATQLINLATRGHLTFQNPEDEHKLDAWIPDVTGNTPGYFLSPLSVVAELTHDAYRYAFKKESALDVAKQIAQNKASPIARAASVLWSGEEYSGKKIDGTWNRIKESGAALIPAPIPVSGLFTDRAGQGQRQITASLGVKTEPAAKPKIAKPIKPKKPPKPKKL